MARNRSRHSEGALLQAVIFMRTHVLTDAEVLGDTPNLVAPLRRSVAQNARDVKARDRGSLQPERQGIPLKMAREKSIAEPWSPSLLGR